MKIFPALSYTLLTFFLAGCHTTAQSAPKPKPENSTATVPGIFLDQTKLTNLLKESEIADPARSLVHVSHICNIVIDQQQYTVVDMRELSKGAQVARGTNQILLLNPGQQLVQRIDYGQARPLLCEKNKLYLYNNISVDGSTAEGNVLVFEDAGFKVTTAQEDLNSLLPLKK